MIKHAAVALFAYLAVACGAPAGEAPYEQEGGGGGGPPQTGFGGAGETPDPSLSLEDFGYAAEDPASLGIQGDTGSSGLNAATICGDVNTTATVLLQAVPPQARSMASATRAREAIASKQAPISSSLRTDDHLSYFRVGAADASPDSLLASMALRQLEIAGQLIPRRYLLYVGVQAGALKTRPPVALTVLVDNTPSMAGEPLARAKKSLRALADALVAGDHLTVLTADTQVVFDQALTDPVAETSGLEEKLSLGADVGLRIPIESALEKASSLSASSQWTRVVLISDGQGDPETLPLTKITDMAKADVRLSSVGVGGSYVIGDALLYRASQAGRGTYVYVDGMDEPDGLLRARFDELFGVAFDDVSLTVSLPWFLKSIDETKPVAADSSARSIAPGGNLSFVYNLESCHESALLKYGAEYPLAVTVSFSKPGQASGNVTGGSMVSDFLTMPAPGLDAVLATRAYVAALRAPTKERFTDAFARLDALKQPGNAFEEMRNLLDAYPKKP